jgi:4,5-dihydroxyphthalate decarboxylase
MTPLELSAAFSVNPVTRPILTGQVAPEGVKWSCSGIHPSEMFWRQLRFGDFDVSEMSLASLYIAVSRGNRDWLALPIFTTRRFFHSLIVVREDAGIENPADLAGRRVGVPEYQQTAAVWTRGALLHEFGVRPEQMSWFMERPPDMSHGGATKFTPPPGLDFRYVSANDTLGAMLKRGDLDASIVYITDRNLVDRSRDEIGIGSGIRYLFDDPPAEGIRYYRATGILPVNHCVVIRTSLCEKHPWLALNIYAAFAKAKENVARSLVEAATPWEVIGALAPEASQALRTVDPLPFGFADQAGVLDILGDYLREQGLIDQSIGVDQVFAKSTLDL